MPDQLPSAGVEVDLLAQRLSRLAREYPEYRILIVTGAGVTAAATHERDGKRNPAATWMGLVRLALAEVSSKQYALKLSRTAEGKKLFTDVQRAHRAYARGSITDKDTLIDDAQRAVAAFDAVDPHLFSAWLYNQMQRVVLTDRTLFSAIEALAAALPRPPLFATTNYDLLLSDYLNCRAFFIGEEGAEAAVDDLLAERSPRAVIHLHGRHDHRMESIFSREQYDRICATNAAEGSVASRLFERTIPLFIGCGSGLGDDDISALLHRRVARLPPRHDLDAIAIVDPTVQHTPLYTPIQFGDHHDQLPQFLYAVAGALPRPPAGRALARYLEALVAEQSVVHVPPAVIGGQRITHVPLNGFFGTLHPEDIKRIDVFADQGKTDLYELRRGSELDRGAAGTVEIDALLDAPLSVVLGDAGSGKTSLVRVLAVQEAKRLKEKTDDGRLPLFLRLADYHRASKGQRNLERPSLDEWIFSDIFALAGDGVPHDDRHDEARQVFQRYARAGRLMLILDGLDEVANPEDRQFVVDEVERLSASVLRADQAYLSESRNRVIVTSRISGYLNAPLTVGNPRFFSVGPIAAERLDAFFDAFFTGVRQQDAPQEEIDAISAALRSEAAERAEVVAGFTRTPLLAAMLIADFCDKRRLPNDLVTLYENVIQLSCRYSLEAFREHDTEASPLPLELLVDALAMAAYRMFSEELVVDVIVRSAFDQALAELLSGSAKERAERAQLLDAALTGEFGLLKEKSANLLAFTHRGLQEYLSGRYLSRMDDAAIGAATRRPGSTLPVTFATMRVTIDEPARIAALARAMRNASTTVNGMRPWLLFLDALAVGVTLSAQDAKTIAELHLEVVEQIVPFIDGPSANRPLVERIARLLRDETFAPALTNVLHEALAGGIANPRRAVAAAILIEQQQLQTEALVVALQCCAARLPSAEGRRISAALRRSATRLGTPDDPQLPPPTPLVLVPELAADDLVTDPRWRRVVASLAGGYADYDVSIVQERVSDVSRYLEASDEDQQYVLLRTLPRSLRQLIREDEDPDTRDPIWDLGVFLDTQRDKTLKMREVRPRFDARFLYRSPALANEIVAAVQENLPPETLVRPGTNQDEAVERTVTALMLALAPPERTTPKVLERLALTADDLRDAALRATFAMLSALQGDESFEQRDGPDIVLATLLDALTSFAAEFRLEIKSKLLSKLGAVSRRILLRELAGAMVLGHFDQDVIYAIAVLWETMNPEDLLHGLTEIGDSRFAREASAMYDVPAYPPSYGAAGLMTHAVADLLDIAESCPPAISLMRTWTLHALAKDAASLPPGAAVEIDALLSLDWGSQSGPPELAFGEKDGLPREAEPTPIEVAYANALRCQLPGPRARALLRLLRHLPPPEQAQAERIIEQSIAVIEDPFEKARTLEMRASRSVDPQVALDAASEARRIAGIEPALRARLLVRLAVYFPEQERRAVLREAAEAASRIEDSWKRAETLRAIHPFLQREERARSVASAALRALPPLLRAYVERKRGTVLQLICDDASALPEWMNADLTAPLIAYGLATEARRERGLDLDEWELLERLDVYKADDIDRVRKTYDAARLPRITAPGLLSLRDLAESAPDAKDAAREILSRAGRFPPGASLFAEQLRLAPDDRLPQLIDAATLGITARNAGSLIQSLSSADDLIRARAATLLVRPRVKSTEDNHRASIVGLDALLEMIRVAMEGPIFAQLRVKWFIEGTLFEGTRIARDLLTEAAAPGTRGAVARRLIGSISSCTFGFLCAMADGADRSPALANAVLSMAAQCLYRHDSLAEHVPAATIERLRAAAAISRARVALVDPEQLAKVVRDEGELDMPGVTLESMIMRAGLLRNWSEVLAGDELWKKLAAVGREFFARRRSDAAEELDGEFLAGAYVLLNTPGAIGRLIGALLNTTDRWLQDESVTPESFIGTDPLSTAMVLAASTSVQYPDTVAAALNVTGLFNKLSDIGEKYPSFPARRAAFVLMPLRWRGRSDRVMPEEFSAVLVASRDVVPVAVAAERVPAFIRTIGKKTLEKVHADASGSAQQTLLLAKALIRIVSNGKAVKDARELAEQVLDQILTGPQGNSYLVHPLLIASAPPRSRLKELVFHEIMLNAV